MADKTELLQAIDDAILDADSLERFINGSDSETVLTRLSAEYPTLQKAIKQMFENGGLPATPYKSITDLEASELVDGDYALVTDAGSESGLYFKEGGEWIKSKYLKKDGDIAVLFEIISNIEGLVDYIDYITFSDYFINSDYNGSNGLTLRTSNGSYIRAFVSGIDEFYIRGSQIDESANWKWVFTKKDFSFVGSTVPDKNGKVIVPDGAYHADRTYTLGVRKESPDLKLIRSKPVGGGELSKLLEGYDSTEVPITYIKDRAINSTENTDLPILTNPVSGRMSLRVDISNDIKALRVSNIGNPMDVWNWLFALSDGSRRISHNSYNATVVDIPDGAIEAYKTLTIGGVNDSSNMVVEGVFKDNNLSKIAYESQKVTSNLDAILAREQESSPFNARALINANDFEGDSQTEQIKQAVEFCKFKGYGIVEISYDIKRDTGLWLIDEAITLPDNCWIYINNVTVKKAPRLHDNVFRNEGIVPNSDPYGFATELNKNTNIRIFGNDKMLSKIEGNREQPPIGTNVNGDTVEYVGDNYGWRGFCVYFVNTDNFRVHDLTFAKATNWTCSNEHGCKNFKYYNLHFDNRDTVNSDGVDVRMGCSGFEIYNITGHTMDDMVALNAGTWLGSTYPRGSYKYPQQVGGFSDRGFGIDVKNGKVWDIKADWSNACLLILASSGGKVQNISVNNISDGDKGTRHYLVEFLGKIYGTPAKLGDISNITVNNVVSNGTPKPIWIRAGLKDVWINKVEQNNASGDSAIFIDGTYQHDNFITTNIKSVV